ncbi:MAG: hypothetical protein H7Y86_17295 [Rhizobacter sp.]|nr:hypothetical protein [Ferruginibacter sp.]
MKISPIILSLLTFFLSFNSVAQNASFVYGENTAFKNDYEEAVKLGDGNIIVLRMIVKTGISGYNYFPELLLVNGSMQTEKETRITLTGDNPQPGFLRKVGRKIFYFYHDYKKSSKETALYGVEINQQTLGVEKTVNMGQYYSEPATGSGLPPLRQSADQSKIMLLAEGKANNKKPQIFFAAVYSNDLTTLWKNEVTMPYSDINVGFYDFGVKNDATACMAIRNYDEGVSNAYKKMDGVIVPAYTVKMLFLNKLITTPLEINIDLNNNFVKDARLNIDKDDNVSITGMTQKKYDGNIAGIFYSTILADNKTVSKTVFKDIPVQIIAASAEHKMASENEKDPGLHREFYLRNISVRNNGSTDVLMEYYYTSPIQNDQFYTYGDLIVANINSAQKVTFTRIPKKQTMKNGWLFLGVATVTYNDKLILLFNDNSRNGEDEQNGKTVTNFNRSVLVMAAVDANGKMTRKNVIDQKEEDYIFRPASLSLIEGNKYIVSAALMKYIKRSMRFGVLEITD